MGRRKKADARAANSTTFSSASSSRNMKKPTHQHAVSPTNGPTTSSQLPRPPPPFTTALPPALSNLTSITTTSTSSSSSYRLLSPRKLYLIHTDHHPPDFKRRIFLVPLVTNTLILAALVYRVCSILPVYIAIGLATLGVPSSTSSSSSSFSPPSPSWTGQQASHVTAGSTPWSWKRDDNILGVIVGRAAMFLVDYILYIAVWPWPRAFFFCFSTPGGPLSWRRRLGGFRAREAVVRVSRRWDVELFSEAVDGKEGVSSTTATTAGAVGRLAREIAQFQGKIHDVQGIREGTGWGEKSQQGGLLKERILPALDPAWMRPRTGYMMLSADWDLHFDAMTTLQGLLDCDDSDSSLSYPLKSSSSEESSTATATATATATDTATAIAAGSGAGVGADADTATSLSAEQKQDKAPPKWSDIDSPLLLVHDSNYGGWCVWRLDDDSSGSSSSTSTPGTTTSGTTTAGAAEAEAEKRAEKEEEAASRQKMKLIKSRLIAVGKESVFYRWVELLQYEYESSRPPPPPPPPPSRPTGSDDNKLTSLDDDDDGDGEVGGGSDGGGYDSDARKQRQKQKQQKQQHDDTTRRQVRELFEKEEINFDEFWRDVEGGVIGVKG